MKKIIILILSVVFFSIPASTLAVVGCQIDCIPASCEGPAPIELQEIMYEADSWLWNTEETTRNISVSTTGTYSVQCFYGVDEGFDEQAVVITEEPPTAKFIPLPVDFTTSILARVGELFLDLSPFVASIGIGLPLSFWAVRKVIALARK